MSKKIIILERQNEPSDQDFKYVLWVAVPAGRESFYANPEAVSAYKGATAQEIQDIRDGKIIEKCGTISRPSSDTFSSVKNALEKIWNNFQSEVNAKRPFNKYGTFWDGTTWIDGGTS